MEAPLLGLYLKAALRPFTKNYKAFPLGDL